MCGLFLKVKIKCLIIKAIQFFLAVDLVILMVVAGKAASGDNLEVEAGKEASDDDLGEVPVFKLTKTRKFESDRSFGRLRSWLSYQINYD